MYHYYTVYTLMWKSPGNNDGKPDDNDWGSDTVVTLT